LTRCMGPNVYIDVNIASTDVVKVMVCVWTEDVYHLTDMGIHVHLNVNTASRDVVKVMVCVEPARLTSLVNLVSTTVLHTHSIARVESALRAMVSAVGVWAKCLLVLHAQVTTMGVNVAVACRDNTATRVRVSVSTVMAVYVSRPMASAWMVVFRDGMGRTVRQSARAAVSIATRRQGHVCVLPRGNMASTVSKAAVITVYREIVEEMYFVTSLPDTVWTDVRLVGIVIYVTTTAATTASELPASRLPETAPSTAWAGGMALSVV
jgi:hypothetical protein